MNTLLLLIVSIHKVCATKSDAPCCFGTLCVEIWFKQIWSIVSGCWNYTTWIASRVSKIASTHSFQDVPPWSRTLQARWGDDISDCTNVWESVTVQLAFQKMHRACFFYLQFPWTKTCAWCWDLGFKLKTFVDCTKWAVFPKLKGSHYNRGELVFCSFCHCHCFSLLLWLFSCSVH